MNSQDLLFENYQLTILDQLENTAFIRLSPIIGEALKRERRKVYIVHSNQEILYVGEAGSSVLKRFQRGCTAFNYKVKNSQARRGYQGYKWLNKELNKARTLDVLVVVFDESYDLKRDFIEAVEGELVYLIRSETNEWPRFQNEIHFSNCVGAKETAEEIFENLLMKINNKEIIKKVIL
ncbi:hypothetical protein J2X31_000113 [Flavobacterium arsenatis]|uniref:GIY-YIG domain-containing protein n=1 Tax=Flavobacterium arsenatis TaxID=1484332 RepID=A0ABU1TJG8_9FLAO|nr:hypothetical protein [Flavobacterium arsenatis]MDR6966120.1 hypothetical protein [Flavobacterium arsenatis]